MRSASSSASNSLLEPSLDVARSIASSVPKRSRSASAARSALERSLAACTSRSPRSKTHASSCRSWKGFSPRSSNALAELLPARVRARSAAARGLRPQARSRSLASSPGSSSLLTFGAFLLAFEGPFCLRCSVVSFGFSFSSTASGVSVTRTVSSPESSGSS